MKAFYGLDRSKPSIRLADTSNEEQMSLFTEEEARAARCYTEHLAEIEAANLAVAEALAAYKSQTWYQTAGARLRFAAYWVTYTIREHLGRTYVRLFCKLTGADSRLVSQRVWKKLGI